MAGYIDNSTDLALFESYSQGRALAGARLTNLSRFAQWSALLDSKTCDWCGWADMRVFDTTIEPYDPPMHHGCRCLVAYITKDEFPPKANWDKGPPNDVWPPGSYELQRAAERSLPKPPPASKPSLVGTEFEADIYNNLEDFQDMLRDRYGIEADFTGMRIADARDVTRTIEKFHNAYPEYRGSLANLGSTKAWNLDASFKKAIGSGGNANGIVTVSPGKMPTHMGITSRKISPRMNKPGNFVTGGGHEGVTWHELGHVVENWSLVNVSTLETAKRKIITTVYDNSTAAMSKDLTIYANKSGHEMFAELFHIANQSGGIKAWATSVEQEFRIRKVISLYEEYGVIIRESQL